MRKYNFIVEGPIEIGKVAKYGFRMKTYNAILIGNGTMGRRHQARFEECGVRFVRTLDLDAAEWIVSEDAAQLASGSIMVDFAVVASPAMTHYEYAKFFLERKIPVLVEKPLATTAAQAQELVELAKRNATLLFVAQSECYNPIFLNFRKHFLLDLKNAVSASDIPNSENTSSSPASSSLNVKLEFRREHGFNIRCRDVGVALDLLIHDVSLFLNLFDARNVVMVDDGCCNCDYDGNHVHNECDDRVRMTLKVAAGEFAGVCAEFIADRNSSRDVRTISAEFGRNGDSAGFDYSVSLVHYTRSGDVAHIPDSLDNEHRFFLKLLAGACGNWADRAVMNAADAVKIATCEWPKG